MGFAAYVFKVSLAIMALYTIYWIAFRQFSFFQWNRFYLVGSVVLSFVLPLLKLPRGRGLAVPEISGIDWEYVDHLFQVPDPFVREAGGISHPSALMALYLLGALVVFAWNSWRFFGIWNLTRNARPVHARPVHARGVKVFVLDSTKGSFTLFRKIYLDRHTFENRPEHVFRHEMVHASQIHSLDLLVMAFVGVLLWFNPFVLLLWRSVRENHEYLADEPARNDPGALAGYLACLRDETLRRYAPAPASFFKSPTIKKRILMLTNPHTRKQKRWRYLAVLPFIALMLLAFQAPLDPGLHASSDEIPSVFPLPDEFREKISWDFNVKAINPITNKENIHNGVDIAAPMGTPVYAAAGGVVKNAEMLDGWGNLLVIEHSKGYSSFYAHLEGFSVKAGTIVKKGQQVATVGNTGLSTGPHLHYEVRKDGTHLNPADYY